MSKGAPILLATTIFVPQEDGTRKQYHRGEAVPGLNDEQIDRLTKCGALGLGSSDEGKVAQADPDRVVTPAIALVTEPSEFRGVGEPAVVPAPPAAVVAAPPLKTAPVADWRAYAVSAHGVSAAEAAEQSKADLIELYG